MSDPHKYDHRRLAAQDRIRQLAEETSELRRGFEAIRRIIAGVAPEGWSAEDDDGLGAAVEAIRAVVDHHLPAATPLEEVRR